MTPPLATLLLVEDEPALRQLMGRALRADGYRVLEARTGSEAEAVYDQHGADVDLLITDVQMPYLSGPDLVSSLRLRRRTLPVLYVTGFPDERASHEYLLVKPFARNVLSATVQWILADDRGARRPPSVRGATGVQPLRSDLPARAV